jgi:hypothetical protein
MSEAERNLHALLSRLARERGAAILAMYLGRFRNLPRDTVREAVQEGFYRELRTYPGRPDCPATMEEAEKLLHTIVGNVLKDDWRRLRLSIERDADYQAVKREAEAIDEDEAAARREQARRKPVEGPARRAPGPTAMEQKEALENALVDKIDGDNLTAKVLDGLDRRYSRICVLLLHDWTPTEIGEAFGRGRDPRREGLVMRRWARVKVCRILGELARRGDEIAARVHERGECVRLLLSAKISDAPG